MRKPDLEDYRLYFVTDSTLHRGYSVLEQVELALKGGVKIIQIREKQMEFRDLITLSKQALKLTREYGAFLIINDSVEVALKTGADGVHLGEMDTSVRDARLILSENRVIGFSVKTTEEAIKAESMGADYVAVNGVFPTQTKTDLGYLPGLEAVRLIRKSVSLPVIGIGGINTGNFESVIEAGAHGVAVVTAITMSENIPETCRLFLKSQ